MSGQKLGSARGDSIPRLSTRELGRSTVGQDVRSIAIVVWKAEGVSQFMGQDFPMRTFERSG